MIFNCYVANCKVITKKPIQSKKKDGSDVTYFQLGIMYDDSLCNVNCTSDVYNDVIVDKTYDFSFKLNTEYDKVRASTRRDSNYIRTNIV